MGAWGIGTFDNDEASDWLYDLEGSEGTALIEESLDRVLAEEDYPESPDCANALAAAEIVAALKGAPAPGLPEDAMNWISANPSTPSTGLIDKASSAVQKVKAASELRELWEESEDFDAWLACVEDVEQRLV